MKSEIIAMGRLYNDLCFLWPLISPPEDYVEEASFWKEVLRETLGEGRHKILELGVGGGHNLSHLTSDFEATAVDLSEPMLAHCRRLNPEVELHVGDMRNVRLGKTFSAVLIHDAVSHILSEADLLKTFRTAAAHLKSGGVFITGPDRFSETFSSPEIDHETHSDGRTEATFLEYTHQPDPNDPRLEVIMTYLIRSGDGLQVELDRLITAVFPKATWTELMSEAGFAVEERTFPLKNWHKPYVLLVGTLR